MRACVCACVRACVHACVRVCMRACVCFLLCFQVPVTAGRVCSGTRRHQLRHDWGHGGLVLWSRQSPWHYACAPLGCPRACSSRVGVRLCAFVWSGCESMHAFLHHYSTRVDVRRAFLWSGCEMLHAFFLHYSTRVGVRHAFLSSGCETLHVYRPFSASPTAERFLLSTRAQCVTLQCSCI
jgi:hypothetical protein